MFGTDWVAKRGRGAKEREATDEQTDVAPGLTVLRNAEIQLQPSNRSTPSSAK